MKKPWLLLYLCMVLTAAHALRAQTLNASAQSLTFTAQVGGTPVSLPLNITSSPSGVIVVAAPVEQTSPQIAWLGVTPTGGATPVPLSVTVDPSGLSPGVYNGSIVVSVLSGGSSSISVPVKLTVGSINVFPPSISFTTAIGNTPAALPVTLTASQQVNFTVSVAATSGGNWLGVSPPSGFVSSTNPTAVVAIPDSTVVPLLSPGTYQATITITPVTGPSLTPVTIPVTLEVTPAPAVTAEPATVKLMYQIGGANNNARQTVVLKTPSPQGVAYTATASSQPNPSGGNWAAVTPASGTVISTGTPLVVSYSSAANLGQGNWLGTLTVNTPNGSPTKTEIPISLFVSNLPLLTVPPDTLNFTYQFGTSNPAAQSVTATTTSAAPLAFTTAAVTADGANWLLVPPNGSTASPLSVSVNPTGLAPGTYTGNVTLTAAGSGNGPQTFPVTLKVFNDPAIVTDLKSVSIAYHQLQAPPGPQAITVSSSNGIPLNYTAGVATSSCGSGWLALGGTPGVTTGQITVALNPQGLSPGTCSGTVTITATNALTGALAVNSPVTIPVTAIVSTSPLLLVTPRTPAVFTAPAGGPLQGPQTYTLTSTATDIISYTVNSSTASGGSGWLQVTPSTGQTVTGANKISISAQPGQLAPGTYTGTVSITAVGAGGAPVPNSPVVIPVTLQITTGSLLLSQASLSFKQAAGGTPPGNQSINVSSTGQPLNFTTTVYTKDGGNWLTATPSGATPGNISVGVNGSQLQQGTYTGTIIIFSTTPNAGNSPAFVTVSLTIHAGTISAGPLNFTFTQVRGGTAPPSQSLSISGSPNALPFSITAATNAGGPWLSASVASGTTPATVQVRIANNSLAAGSYVGTLTIASAGADGSPITVSVTLNVVVPYSISASPRYINLYALPGETGVRSSPLQITSSGDAVAFNVATSGESWLGISATSGNTPGGLLVSANPTGLAAGIYTSILTVTSPNSTTPVTVTVNLVIGSPAPPVISAVANAASYSTGAITPGENVVIFGSGIGPSVLAKGTVTNNLVDTDAGATRVLFDGVPSPVIYAASNQTSVMVPYSLSGHANTSVVVEYRGVASAPLTYNLAQAAPGIYTQNAQGSGPGAILNQDFTVNLPSAPAAKGSVVSVYMTGEGYTAGAVDGELASGLLSPALPVTATVGGIPAPVIYAGTSPGIITGAMQVNVQIPAGAPSGAAVPLVITIGSGSAAIGTQGGVTISIQ